MLASPSYVPYQYHEWLDHGSNAALCADIKQVYETNLPVTAGDVKLQTKRGSVHMSYFINPLTPPSSGCALTVGQPPAERSPSALFPGVRAAHRSGVMVFLQNLSLEIRTKQAFERVLPPALAEQVMGFCGACSQTHDAPPCRLCPLECNKAAMHSSAVMSYLDAKNVGFQ